MIMLYFMQVCLYDSFKIVQEVWKKLDMIWQDFCYYQALTTIMPTKIFVGIKKMLA